jgi:DNA-binding FrmR family transcriptional regulator
MKGDRENAAKLLRTARGQIDGIIKMVEEDRYCVDVSNQILAAISILRKVNTGVLRAHLDSCVKDTLLSGSEAERRAKIEEMMAIIEKNAR